MCICINCFYLQNCSVYRFIETQHQIKVDQKKSNSSFIPKQTIIKNEITVTSQNSTIVDWDVSECSNFFEKPGVWLEKT